MSDALEVWLDDAELSAAPRLVGTLARAQSRAREAIRFRYAAEWTSGGRRAFAIDPELPLTPGDFHPSAGGALRATARFYRLKSTAAARIEAQVRKAVGTWRRVAVDTGLGASEFDALAEVLEQSAR